MKYFFLSDGWTYRRVWEFGGLWDRSSWRRKPQIERLNCGILERQESLWLYQVEDAVITIEVCPLNEAGNSNIGQVVLKRLIGAEQVIEILTRSELVFNSQSKLNKN
ncbi:hypothetical protein [Myxosarcina sp. GI1]|uniref:hypothetical protein n=1 Tax=Myxosarcina sp. GI1 TaxID=1541065 RepID=UPI0005644840|nr:hypothetical protein [Myxosarcina sp. GI1]